MTDDRNSKPAVPASGNAKKKNNYHNRPKSGKRFSSDRGGDRVNDNGQPRSNGGDRARFKQGDNANGGDRSRFKQGEAANGVDRSRFKQGDNANGDPNNRNRTRKNSGGNNSGARRTAQSRKPREHDGFDDIKIRGGQYVAVDNDDYDTDSRKSFDSHDYSGASRRHGSAELAVLPGAVVGRNAVRELLKSNRSIDKLYVKNGDREGSIVVLIAEAASRGIPIIEVESQKLDAMAGGENHQGVIALAAEKEYTDVDGILKIAEERGEKPLIVIADGVEDPHNLGAIIRCAECAGAHGIIIPKRRAAGLTPTVTKASAGAIEHMAIAKVNNIVQTIDSLKQKGLWIFSAEAGGEPYYKLDFDVPSAIVLGSEGDGVGRLIKEKSDYIVSIPMYGSVNSLNVSTAAAVILCHAARMQHGCK